MWKNLLEIDRSLAVVANWGLHVPVLDLMLTYITGNLIWAVLLSSYLAWVIYKKNWHGLRVILALIILLVLADFIAYGVLKPYFGRLRPCKVLFLMRINSEIGCAGWQSFPSNHATNSMVILTWIAFNFRSSVTLIAAFLTGIVGFSRVYFGVHYPLDIVGGYCVGFGLALVGVCIWCLIENVVGRWRIVRQRLQLPGKIE